MMKKIATLLTMVTVAMMAVAQMANPVTFTSQLKTTNGSSEGENMYPYNVLLSINDKRLKKIINFATKNFATK